MKQFALWAIALALVLTSCGKGTSFSLKGKLADNSANGKMLLLQKYNLETGETKTLDSAIIKGNEFEFHGEAKEEPDFNIIVPQTPDGKTPTMSFVREPGDIKIEVKDIQNYTVSGTKINDQFQKMQSDILALQQSFNQASPTPQREEEVVKQLISVCYNYAKENIQNPTGEQVFNSIAGQLSSQQIKDVLKNARASFKDKEPMKMLIKSVEAKEKMTASNEYQDVALIDRNGSETRLSDYVSKSKYVLIDFWASWCQPCIQEMPNLVSAYAKYKSKGLEIVSISVDKDKESWLKAVGANKMSWVQLNDVDGKASQIYGVQSIPFTMLINQAGKIVATNLRDKDLEMKLNELLK